MRTETLRRHFGPRFALETITEAQVAVEKAGGGNAVVEI